MKRVFLLATLLVPLICGCTQSACPECPIAGGWSECDSEGLKVRTNYECNETSSACESYEESMACATSLTLNNNDLNVIISPTLDVYVNGIIKFEATSLPDDTTKIYFMMYPQNEPINMSAGLTINQVFAIDNADTIIGWTKYVDTTGMKNGVYNVAVMSSYEGAPESNPWLAIVQTQLLLNN